MVRTRKSGQERFSLDGQELDSDLLGFWRWSVSDLLSNATRRRLAEYIVALALEVPCDVRAEWDAYDLQTLDGVKVEVKSSAYVQSWLQKKPSRISFGCQSTTIIGGSGESDRVSQRRSDVYVFALLNEPDRDRVDPMALDQWEFYVVSTRVMNDRFPTQKTVSLGTVRTLADAVLYSQLAARVHACHLCRKVPFQSVADA